LVLRRIGGGQYRTVPSRNPRGAPSSRSLKFAKPICCHSDKTNFAWQQSSITLKTEILFPEYGGGWGLPRRLVGLGPQHIGENAALLGTEDALIAAGIQHRLALVERDSAQVAEGVPHHRLPICR